MKKVTALAMLNALVDEGVLEPAKNHPGGYMANADALPIDAKIGARKTALIAWDGSEFVGMDAPWWEKVGAAYASLNVLAEVGKATVWCRANPSRVPKSRAAAFLNSWLAKAHAKMGKGPGRDHGRNAAAATMAGE